MVDFSELSFEHPAGYKQRGAKAPRPSGVVNLFNRKPKRASIDLTKVITASEVRELGFEVYESLLSEFKWSRDKAYIMSWRSFKSSFNIYFSKDNYDRNCRRTKIDKGLVIKRINQFFSNFQEKELGKELNYITEVKENYLTKDGFYVRVIFN